MANFRLIEGGKGSTSNKGEESRGGEKTGKRQRRNGLEERGVLIMQEEKGEDKGGRIRRIYFIRKGVRIEVACLRDEETGKAKGWLAISIPDCAYSAVWNLTFLEAEKIINQATAREGRGRGRPRTAEAKVRRIVRLYNAGMLPGEIAREVRLPRPTIYTILGREGLFKKVGLGL